MNISEIKGKTITVWFSCGAASAVAAKLTIEKYGKENTVIVVNNPIKEEDEDNLRFLHDIEKWIGQKIEFATNPEFPSTSIVEVFEKRKYMSGVRGNAVCTFNLKKGARYAFEKKVNIDYHVLGFTADEKHRHDRFTREERGNVLSVLIDENITKQDSLAYIEHAGILLPRMYRLGYPNANCPGCVKATSPTYWNLVRKTHPEVFINRAEISRKLGVKLVRHKGKRIFLDELPEDAVGRKIKSYDCGNFCDTK